MTVKRFNPKADNTAQAVFGNIDTANSLRNVANGCFHNIILSMIIDEKNKIRNKGIKFKFRTFSANIPCMNKIDRAIAVARKKDAGAEGNLKSNLNLF